MLFISLLFFSVSTHALDEFITKQSLNKIRYISKDGKITYYQKNTGELNLSTNYKFASIFKAKKNSQYLLYASNQKKLIAIELDQNFFTKQNILKNNEILITEFGKESNITQIAKGRSPKLHLNDNWISYYDIQEKNIHFKNLKNDLQSKKIALGSNPNPYFLPTELMITPNDVIYTNINTEGYSAVLAYSFIDQTFKTIFKTSNPGMKLDICRIEDQLVIGSFPYGDIKAESAIFTVPLFNNKDYRKIIPIYNSELPDIGNLKCSKQNVFFIKTMGVNEKLNSKKSEIAKLNINTKELTIKSNFKHINQIFKIGELVVANYQGKYYIIEGKESLISDEIIKDAKNE